MKTTSTIIPGLSALLLLLLALPVSATPPDIVLSWPEDMGFPDEINWNSGYPEIFFGGPYSVTVEVSNRSDDETLTLAEINTSPEQFSVEPATLEVEPHSQGQFVVTFESHDAGQFDGTLTIISNDPESGRIEIPLHAEASGPPIVVPVLDIIAEEVFTGEVIQRTLRLENQGGSSLRFQIEVVYLEGEVGWLSVDPTEGEIASGARIDLTATLDASLLAGGEYSAEIRIQTNDPTNPEITCAVFMWIPEGQHLYATFPAEWGWPEVLDFNRAYDDIFVGIPETLQVEVENTGIEAVEIVDVAFDNEAFAISPQNVVIEAGERQLFDVIFNADASGEYWATATFQTDDPEQDVFEFTAHSLASEPPQIVVEPESLELTGEQWGDWDGNPLALNVDRFVVKNVGASVLRVDSISTSTNQDFAFGADVQPSQFSLNPGDSQVVRFDLLITMQGDFAFQFDIYSNDPSASDLVISANIHVTRDFGDPHWPIEHNGPNHALIVTDIRFDGEQVARGWQVGVFTPAGVMAGSGIWQLEELGIAVWGADQEYRDLFQAGQTMAFKLWDPNTDTEYDAVATVTAGSLEWQENEFTVLSLTGYSVNTLRIPLRPGWNLMSLNVRPPAEYWRIEEGPDVTRLMASLRIDRNHHHVQLMKNERGNFFLPDWNGGWNQIIYWNLQEGYLAKLDTACVFEMDGELIPPDVDIRITRGWNMIAYYPTYSLSASRASNFYVLSPIIEHVLIAKDDQGHFMVPSNNFSNMDPWHEGKGYQVRVNADVVLNYPAEQERDRSAVAPNANRSAIVPPRATGVNDEAVTDGMATAELVHFQSVTMTGKNMSLLITAEAGMQNIKAGEIGVFTKSGVCVGASAFQNSNSTHQIGLAVWGDDPATEEIDGTVEGEGIILRIWDGASETVIQPNWTEGKGVYETDGLICGEVSLENTRDNAHPDEFTLFGTFPNPFNSTTEIRYSIPEAGNIAVTLTDLEGREVARVWEGYETSGQHSVVLSGSELSAGVYFVHLTVGADSRMVKIVLIK